MPLEILEIGKYVITALGGGAAALALFVKFGTNRIANVIEAKYQNKLNKDLQAHKAEMDAKNHVTQLRFDKEFEVLHKLVSDYYEFTMLTWDVYLALPSASEEDFNDKYSAFENACDEYTKYFYKNSVIISKEIADAFEVGIGAINKFRNLSGYCRKEYVKYSSSGKTDTDGFNTHVTYNVEMLGDIHDELNKGTEYGIKTMIDLVRSYLDSLEIV